MKKIECPLCNNSRTKELLKAKDWFKVSDQKFSIRKCLECKIIFTYPVLSWEEVKKFYPEIYFWRKEYRAKSKFVRLTRKIEEFYFRLVYGYETKRLVKFLGNKGSVLDGGCGTGMRLEAFKKAGFTQYFGVEPLTKIAQYAKQTKGLPVINQTLEEFGKHCPENSFDIVTLYDVFEHLSNPIAHLKLIKKILKPQGYLVLKLPTFDSFQAKLFKSRWCALAPPLHYFHYTVQTISQLLSHNGFEVKIIDRKTNLVHPTFWGLSFFDLKPQWIWQKENEGKPTKFSKLLLILSILISIIPTYLEYFFKGGASIVVYAINKKI